MMVDLQAAHAEELNLEFVTALEAAGMTDVLDNQIRYAIRLACCDEDLLYEEMYKLFCVLDEIRALQMLGLVAQEGASETAGRSKSVEMLMRATRGQPEGH